MSRSRMMRRLLVATVGNGTRRVIVVIGLVDIIRLVDVIPLIPPALFSFVTAPPCWLAVVVFDGLATGGDRRMSRIG